MRARTPASRRGSPACASTSARETQVAEGVPAGGYADEVEYAEGEWVANADTGEMEWHAADGSVMSQAEWAGESGRSRSHRCRRRRPPTRPRRATDERRGRASDDGAERRCRRDDAAETDGMHRARLRPQRDDDVQLSSPRSAPHVRRVPHAAARSTSWSAASSTQPGRRGSTAPRRGAVPGCAGAECFDLAVRRRAFERSVAPPVQRRRLDRSCRGELERARAGNATLVGIRCARLKQTKG